MVKKKREDRVQTKKDTGIATVKAPMSTGEIREFKISEELRDRLNKLGGQPQRPSGIDINRLTTKDLEEMQYSGFRLNFLSGDVELWILGRVGGRRRLQDCEKNPGILATLHEEVFATTGSVITTDVDNKDIRIIKSKDVH